VLYAPAGKERFPAPNNQDGYPPADDAGKCTVGFLEENLKN
jgi:hypothetical protein